MTSACTSGWRPLGLASLFGLLGVTIGLGAPACKVQSIFTCSTDDNCIAEAGVGAICDTAQNFCQVPDPACQLGYRWFERSTEDLAGKCLEDTLPVGTGTGVAGTAGASSGGSAPGTTGGDSSDGGPATTVAMTTNPDPSTTGAPADTGASTGSMGATCDEQFGTAPGYMYCSEAPGTCSFVAMTAMTISCNDICAMFGVTCAATDLNDVDPCLSTGATTCDDIASNDVICTCNTM